MVSKGYAIRVSNISDVAAVTSLLEQSYPALVKSAYDPETLGPALKLLTSANPALLASGTYYVAEVRDGTIVGCGGWTRERPGGTIETQSTGHLRHFGTHPGWTRLGIGSAIFRWCKRNARSAGIREFECYSSLNAESFYRALGFTKISEFSIEMTSNVSMVVSHMRCRVCAKSSGTSPTGDGPT